MLFVPTGEEELAEEVRRQQRRFSRRTFLMGAGAVLGAVTTPAWLGPFKKPVAAAIPMFKDPLAGFRLRKYGSRIIVSEAFLERQQLACFQRGLDRMGRQIEQDLRDMAEDSLFGNWWAR